ncbi:hypothetical protein RclHR1_01990029 [Rhizophagus clarus]|uniref:Uncharacterized protein n=1 Tax=Rhizophagus clarus TaxID=94130 RepID=A0A2Z6QQB3_9GLOM|nr:hypothetical protein RclHR1_01990029 [Rhizophagus clarus]
MWKFSQLSAKIIEKIRNMINTNITLICLIIPSGRFNDLSLNNLTLRITLPRNGAVSTLQTAIQNELAPPYNNIPFDIHQVYHPGILDERRM